jgi:hypothetical protein
LECSGLHPGGVNDLGLVKENLNSMLKKVNQNDDAKSTVHVDALL